MSYRETIKYLESFVNYEKIRDYPYKKSYKLQRIKSFLNLIGDPQNGLRIIHVAGTKGKGSTSAFIAYILREAGFNAGLYTSPHLIDFRERIRILRRDKAGTRTAEDFEGMISRDSLVSLVRRLKPFIEKHNMVCKYGPLSFFEIYTAIAFAYFKEKKTDFVVLETGLGGRLDATNVSDSLVSVITPISYEHTQKLGNTLKEISREKAGIIKRKFSVSGFGVLPVVISAPQDKEAGRVIRNRCKAVSAGLYEVGKDIKYNRLQGLSFKFQGIYGQRYRIRPGLLGGHQLVNAAVAIGAVESLRKYNICIGRKAIEKGISKTVWPGRCEVASRRPLVVLDGAQNAASASELKKAIRENFSFKRLILILGISSDKDIKGICSELKVLADKIILTRADNLRAAEPDQLARYFSDKPFYITGSVKEARKKALELASKKDMILVCGSLFVVGEFKNDK